MRPDIVLQYARALGIRKPEIVQPGHLPGRRRGGRPSANAVPWLGIDEHANRAGQMRITAEASGVRVYVVPTDEEKIIAAHIASGNKAGPRRKIEELVEVASRAEH